MKKSPSSTTNFIFEEYILNQTHFLVVEEELNLPDRDDSLLTTRTIIYLGENDLFHDDGSRENDDLVISLSYI